MKTDETLNLERNLWKLTHKIGVFGCPEVTIGFGGKERVDYMTLDTKDIFRCYEIKITKSDFYSKSSNTFVGNFNYYVIPFELFHVVEKDIPDDIGVYGFKNSLSSFINIKKANKKILSVDSDILKNSLIRSLYREYNKYMQCFDFDLIKKYKRELNDEKSNSEFWKKQYNTVMQIIINKYGENWDSNMYEEESNDDI